MNLKPGIQYIVTRGSEDGTLLRGDRFKIDEEGCIVLKTLPGGWLTVDDSTNVIKEIHCIIDDDWLSSEKEKAVDKFNSLEEASAKK